MTDYNTVSTTKKEHCDIHLRNVDLNLLTVFDVVMQMQNVTRAAQVLGMSQPAVSNAVSRLKSMFNDELFVRYGRGIQPTSRAKQLFGPVRQALQLVHNELPGAGFDPQQSERTFNLSICSPLDIRIAAGIVDRFNYNAPHIDVMIRSYLDDNIAHQLKYQETEFVISYNEFEKAEYQHKVLFNDELVLAVSQNHPRICDCISLVDLACEKHAIMSLDSVGSFSKPYYTNTELSHSISYQGTDLNSVLNIVSQTYLVAIAPRWLVEYYSSSLKLRAISLPWKETYRPCYLIWHESTTRDKGHQWMKSQLGQLSEINDYMCANHKGTNTK
ncbi:transcriptional regulator LeuO [Moellerella wisconsensis]|uniref:Transcriptional regulator LeuO n=2 Tax=Moellerella wisconsensis TaxID=158849 RepID=A0ACD3Y5Y5_9GAMM|nr:transcriptional regulator LeuO [Moellerella wisconsensis]KLN96560.1 transcriptional regulator [Moellerella wisconsensis]UNH23415.1 transcriptional regulator LeuO [Moellerella wisconsensis]UNH29911.1 transcriptional regulator LeuO [Moellerella wisconsensis]UNH38136.1 transcriptional regulator LeuO [Moellerella wisconsensis]UNH41630.1 transcriptional regulator LeuO [Moellerella wisconsensis]